MKLIDKDALVAEIDKHIKDAPISYIGHHRVWAYNDVKNIIDTLELKEVDLENIAAVEWDNSIRKINGDPDNAYFLIKRNDYIELTKHLFKLVLQSAQKGISYEKN